MNRYAWVAFWILGLIWGSSFLLIRVGVEEISAGQLVFIRTLIAALGLNTVVWLRGLKYPRNLRLIRALMIIGVGNASLPYMLISLSETQISSGMAAVLQATASLFTLVIAHFVFVDERINRKKVMGLIVGFIGVVILSSESFSDGVFDSGIFWGQLAMVAASLCYAIFTVYSRVVIKQKIEPIVVAATTFISSAISGLIFMLIEPLLGGRSAVPLDQLPTDALFAVLMLGFLNTFIAYLFFYYIVQQLGSFKSVMVTYVVPPVGLILGAIVLKEEFSTWMLFGALLIFTGIA
ncbi:MAG: hypothetical protein CUN56_04440, partial [Phototrophicales bacterium]